MTQPSVRSIDQTRAAAQSFELGSAPVAMPLTSLLTPSTLVAGLRSGKPTLGLRGVVLASLPSACRSRSWPSYPIPQPRRPKLKNANAPTPSASQIQLLPSHSVAMCSFCEGNCFGRNAQKILIQVKFKHVLGSKSVSRKGLAALDPPQRPRRLPVKVNV